jgi:hypothetical protein
MRGRHSDIPYLHFDASSTTRIILNPATLLPYAFTEQVFWYVAINPGKWTRPLRSIGSAPRTATARGRCRRRVPRMTGSAAMRGTASEAAAQPVRNGKAPRND